MTFVVEFDEVTRGYADGVVAVDSVTLNVSRGDFMVIRGRSGSGKSTLLNLMGLLDKPTSGRIRLGGVDADPLTESARTKLRGEYIGFVFQLFNLLPLYTAVDNVALPLTYAGVGRRRRRRLAAEALARVGLAHRSNAFPPTLSGGERQRVAIARALVSEPQLLLCDEPTGSLDRIAAAEILSLLVALNATGLTIVLVTHDDEVASAGSSQVRVDDGRIQP